ncbi:hypothetical protein [Azospirillum soli]|uniref:hypothetical protein n=1 Tax=Azospirillum soli TaxID=1304799 RepID=UPI001AE45578|nr:hypothetical protein [Azospirillum soli]MBP2315511.1 hypothetical protein [Azospirillum soli]
MTAPSIVKPATDLPPPPTLAGLLGREDYVRLAPATNGDVATLAGSVDGEPVATLDDIWIVRMDEREHLGAPWATWLHTVGTVEGLDEPVVTSPIERVDAARGVVLTQTGSVYGIRGGLAALGEGEPPVDHLLAFARALRQWGYGRACDLQAAGWVEPASAVRWGGWPPAA